MPGINKVINIAEHQQIYVYLPPVDMRKAIDGLSVLLVEELNALPQSGDIYLFHNKPANKVKALYWDKNGFVLHYKRLEKGRFKFPKTDGNENISISHDQLSWLFAGLDFMLMDEFKDLNFENYF